ncbi:hypothetical protein HK100_011076, partial [Physocladia obscura]
MNNGFHARTTAEEVAAFYGDSLSSKTIVVTGANGGLGRETARVLAKHGARVILACRNVTSAQETVDAFQAEGIDTAKVHVQKLDVGDFASVRAFAADYARREWPLHVLVNNAAIMALRDRTLAGDGNELQFQTNHLGHFLLTNLLAPVLRASAPARVVCVSSSAHRRGAVRFDDPAFDSGYDRWLAYAQAKTANILFALQLNKLLAAKGVEAFALHPGGIMTHLQEHVSEEEKIAMGWITADGSLHPIFKTIPQGASTHLVAALSPDLSGKGGAYLEDCQIAQPSDWAKDPVQAEKLWALSEEKVGQKFSYSVHRFQANMAAFTTFNLDVGNLICYPDWLHGIRGINHCIDEIFSENQLNASRTHTQAITDDPNLLEHAVFCNANNVGIYYNIIHLPSFCLGNYMQNIAAICVIRQNVRIFLLAMLPMDPVAVQCLIR